MINGESSFRILLVDDDEVAHKSIGGFLQDLGYQVLVAENGKQALDILQKEHGISLVISDIRMPVMNGLELLKSVHKKERKVPVILITGYEDIDSGVEALLNRAYKYMKKPINLKKLITCIKGIEKKAGNAVYLD